MLSLPQHFCKITDFSSHILSYASFINLDVKKEIALYSIFLVSLFTIGGVAFYIIHNFSSIPQTSFSTLLSKLNFMSNNKFVIPIYVSIALSFIASIFILPLSVIAFFVICIVMLLIFKANPLSMDKFLSVYLSVIFAINILIWLEYYFLHSNILFKLIPFLCATTFLSIIFLKINQNNTYITTFLSFSLSIVIISICIGIETYNTLLCREIYISTNSLFLSILILDSIFIIFAKKHTALLNHKEIFSVLAFSWMTNIKVYSTYANLDLFESANHGNSISSFLLNNQIPIVDNFDAHMLSNTIPALIHYAINKDYFMCLTSPYAYFYSIIFTIALFYLACEFANKSTACLFTIIINIAIFFVPHTAIPNPVSFMSWVILIIIFLKWEQKRNIINTFIFWLLAALCLSFQLDSGLAFGFTSIILPIIILIKERDFSLLRQYLSVGFILATIIGSSLFIYISSKYAFIDWLFRFLSFVNSNQNWSLGPVNLSDLISLYFLLPVFTLIAILSTHYFYKFSKRQMYTLAILLCSFLFNASRTLVRHSSIESSKYVLCIPLLVIILIILKLISVSQKALPSIIKNNSLVLPLLLLISLLISIGLSRLNVLDYSIEHSSRMYYSIIDSFDNEKTETQINDTNLAEFTNEMNNLFSLLLEDDETFFDFSNSTALFDFLKLNNPIYANQSPALISGDYGQQSTICELSKKKNQVPLVLMKNSVSPINDRLDGIFNIDRYYLIYEYLLDNYVFLYADDNIELWCLPTQKDKYTDILASNGFTIQDLKEDSYHTLGYIPFLWANYDNDNIKNYSSTNIPPTNVRNCSEGYFIIVEIESTKQLKNQMIAIAYDNNMIDFYSINILPGKNKYKIRVSNSYNWKNANVIGIDIENTQANAYNFFFTKNNQLLTQN